MTEADDVGNIYRARNMRYVLGILTCVLIGGLSCPTPSKSDMAPVVPLARGGAVSPKSPHAFIRMDSEQVFIRLKRSSYTVDAVFHFFNTGETSTEWVGFPKLGFDMTKSHSRLPEEFIRFETWVDGSRVEVSEEREPEGAPGIVDKLLSVYYTLQLALGLGSPQPPPVKERWLVHHVTFPGQGRTTISTSYEAHYSRSSRSAKAYYIVGTGRHWKDVIGRAVFIVDSTDAGGTNSIRVNFPMAAGPRLMGDSLLRFEIEHVEPPPDGELVIEILRSGSGDVYRR